VLIYAPLRQGPTASHALRLVPELPAPSVSRAGILSGAVHVALKDLYLKDHQFHSLLERAQNAGGTMW
jgi:hypothetical protein